MAVHQLTEHFNYFFGRINPWVCRASSEYNTVKGLIEDAHGDAETLAPQLFLQGSYRRETAIYTINDIDIIALCRLWFPPSQGGGAGWGRDRIFGALARPLLDYGPYAGKVSYGARSMCIKLDLGIKVEILPVVYAKGNNDPSTEPFYLYRPETGKWEQGFATYHQQHLTDKNARTGGRFIPCIKVLKHIRSRFGHDAASFHIECLLNSLHDASFHGSPADYIAGATSVINSHTAATWWGWPITTPCGDRTMFNDCEWNWDSWAQFHKLIAAAQSWVAEAVLTGNRARAIECWQQVLGADYFPAY